MGYDCEVCMDMCEGIESYSTGLTICDECGREFYREDTMYCTCPETAVDEWCGIHGFFQVNM